MPVDQPNPPDTLTSALDPRAQGLGKRAWIPSFSDVANCDNEATYHDIRYSIGVAEGPEEIPSGKCFPLEYNADYMHGVSFHKGCYIGQELTARVHHTGVVRKRIMPLELHQELSPEPELDSNILTVEGGKRVGKLRGLRGQLALGLIRVEEVGRERCQVLVGQTKADVWAPNWWPVESPKKSQKGRGAMDE